MNHWQSACRLLIVTFALTWLFAGVVQAQDGAADPVETEAAPAEAADAVGAGAGAKARRDPADWGDWRNYNPSVIFGMGVTWDQYNDSSFAGATRTKSGSNRPECRFVPEPGPGGVTENCFASAASDSGFYEGGAINLGGRLTLPEFDMPSRPQPFFNVSYAFQRQDAKALASSGVPEANWLSSTDVLGSTGEDPFLRLEQTVDPVSTLFIGFGAGFLLPIESYDVRLNGSINYFRSKSKIGSRYDFLDTPRGGGNFGELLFVEEDFVVHGIAPGIGLDVDIGSNKWLAFGFFTDVFVGIPLSDTNTSNTLFNGFPTPPSGPQPDEKVDFHHDRGINISVFLGLRVSLAQD